MEAARLIDIEILANDPRRGKRHSTAWCQHNAGCESRKMTGSIGRIALVDNGRTLEALIWVEDSGAFNMPWSAVQRWRRREGNTVLELVCAENSQDYFGYEVKPIPQAAKSDF